ncbi:MAG: AmmeMemoRadiSam system protein B [Caldilinea sp.]
MAIRAETLRAAAVAGHFYPAVAARLAATVQHYLNRAMTPPLDRVRALLTPHAGYVCSGPVAGAAFAALRGLPEDDRIVYLLGPAHYKAVHGIGLSSARAFATPLGEAPVAAEQMTTLLATGLAHIDDLAHAPEHCLEVELPFLQCALAGRFAIAPMLLDDEADLPALAEFLAEELARRPADLLVVSSDLSHHHPYEEAVRRDRTLLKAIRAGDLSAVCQGEACGLAPIRCLLWVAERLDWRAHILAYANSGDTCGLRHDVVGYGAAAFTESR